MENMENLLLVEEPQTYVPEIKVFRDYIDHHPWIKREEIMIKVLYLTGNRASEIITKVSPRQLELGMTKPYGILLKWNIVSYKKPDGKIVKVLLVHSAVAKSKHNKVVEQPTPETSPQEMIDRSEQSPPVKTFSVPMKTIPIVLDPACEPWCLDILHWIKDQKDEAARERCLRFNCTEMTVQNIVKRNLRDLDPHIHPHLLRHYRVTHLQQGYDFTPLEVCAFTRWSIVAQSKQKGIAVSKNLDIYSHLNWKDYVDKLLVPLEEIL